jgi:hypothetical protein
MLVFLRPKRSNRLTKSDDISFDDCCQHLDEKKSIQNQQTTFRSTITKLDTGFIEDPS